MHDNYSVIIIGAGASGIGFGTALKQSVKTNGCIFVRGS